MNELRVAIEKFKYRQKEKTGIRASVPWGKWYDSHNIDNVLLEAMEIYYINQFKQKLYATNLFKL